MKRKAQIRGKYLQITIPRKDLCPRGNSDPTARKQVSDKDPRTMWVAREGMMLSVLDSTR